MAEKNVAIDRIDRAIIDCLRDDARVSYKELGERVFLSANAVSERVRRLEAGGVIQGYALRLDWAALGLPLAAIIEVKLSPGTTAAAFEAQLRDLPGVLEATLVTGQFDYLLRVACRDQESLVQLTESLRARGGVHETYSRVPLRTVKLGRQLE